MKKVNIIKKILSEREREEYPRDLSDLCHYGLSPHWSSKLNGLNSGFNPNDELFLRYKSEHESARLYVDENCLKEDSLLDEWDTREAFEEFYSNDYYPWHQKQLDYYEGFKIIEKEDVNYDGYYDDKVFDKLRRGR